MTTKKQTTKESTGARKAPAQVKENTQRLPENYSRFFQAWTNMSQDIEEQVNLNLKKQQEMYGDFFGRWNKLSAEIGSRLNKERMNEGVREFYDVWRNYANKMGPRLQKAMTEGMQGYGSIAQSLDKYTQEMRNEAQGIFTKPEDPRSLDQLYDAWQGFGSSVRTRMEAAMGQEWSEADELTRTWLDFSTRMQKLIADAGGKGTDYTALTELWQKFSKEIGGSVTSVVNGTSEDMNKLQKTWNDYYSKVERELVRIANDSGTKYQQLYIRFFDQQSEPLKSLGRWWQTAAETARKQLDDVQARLFEVEKTLRETKR